MSAAKGAQDLVLKATSVTRRFGGLVAVSKVDFEIPRGMIAAIIGPNGAGKTTFFNVVAGIYAPTEGHIEINGKRLISPPTGASREPALLLAPILPMIGAVAYFLFVVGGVEGFYEGVLSVVIAMLGFVTVLLLTIVRPLWYVRFIKRFGITRPARPNDMVEAGLARTFQNIRLYKSMTVLENITLSPVRTRGMKKDAARAKALALLERFGLADKASSYPDQLSGGQQQRVAVAR
ncbi:MAG: ATP-binding cassette domain-containing protein, partial [Candidatus Limnocylindrus sp.]